MRHARTAAVVMLVATTLALGLVGRKLWAVRGAARSADTAPLPASRPATLRADGVVQARPGAHVTLRADVGTTVKRVLVVRGQQVHKGDVLVEFERGQQLAALQEAWAQASEAQTHLKARSDDYNRSKELVASGSLPKHDLDSTASERKAASARLAAAGAAAKRLGVALEKTHVVAPIDGTVLARTVEAGETIAPGASLFEIADLSHLRIEAEVDEYYLDHISVAAAVEITAEAFAGRTWASHVEELGDAVVPRRLRPMDPSRPGDVGVLEVWIALPSGTPLKLGQRVQISAIATTKPGEPARIAGR